MSYSYTSTCDLAVLEAAHMPNDTPVTQPLNCAGIIVFSFFSSAAWCLQSSQNWSKKGITSGLSTTEVVNLFWVLWLTANIPHCLVKRHIFVFLPNTYFLEILPRFNKGHAEVHDCSRVWKRKKIKLQMCTPTASFFVSSCKHVPILAFLLLAPHFHPLSYCL